MARSVVAIPMINPKSNSYELNSVLSRHGFKFKIENDEDVWKKDGGDDIVQYIKLSYSEMALGISVWVKHKSDTNEFIEYAVDLSSPEEYEINKNILEIILETETSFGGFFKKKHVWVYE